MGTVFIWCSLKWVGEKAEREYSGSADYDYDCVVEWWGGVEWMCVLRGGEGEQK